MAKHRELASVVYASTLGTASASKIWRTVVFAGAMLAAPLGTTGCGGGGKKDNTTVQPVTDTKASDDKAAADKAAADKEMADKQAADKAAADKAEADKKAAEEQAAKEEADKKAAAELAAKEEADKKAAEDAKKKPRPRTTTKSRPTGRGFILS